MKRRDLIKKLESIGFRLERNGARHDVYRRGDEEEMIPRHAEINERLAKAILKRRGYN
jgi:mRNA interferase HicA